MDELTAQDWAEALLELREHRRVLIKTRKNDTSKPFTETDFFDLSIESLENVAVKWWEFEQKSIKAAHPDPAIQQPQSNSELRSVIEFETGAIEDDFRQIRADFPWDEDAIAKGRKELSRFAGDLVRSYSLKIDAALRAPGKSERAVTAAPANKATPAARRSSGGSGGASGFSLLTMFVVGLILGGGPAVYFWDQARRTELRFNEDRAALVAENRKLKDNMSLLQEKLSQLAMDETRSIPELRRLVESIRADFAKRRRAAESDYNGKREYLMKRVPAGDRLDRSLEELQEDRRRRLADLDAQETARLDPHLQELDLLQRLVVR